MNSFVVLSAILGATMAAPAADADAQLIAGHGLVYAAAPAVAAAAPVAAVAAAPAVATVAAAPVHKTVQTHLVPQTRLVGHQVSHSVHHVPRVHTETKASTHTTHHVINHPPVVGAYAGAALP